MEEVQRLKEELHTLKCKQAVASTMPTQSISSDCGTDINAIESFNEEFKVMIETMNTMLATETKMFSGGKQLTYEEVLKDIEGTKPENELSMDKATIT
jgi:hypothetical protein